MGHYLAVHHSGPAMTSILGHSASDQPVPPGTIVYSALRQFASSMTSNYTRIFVDFLSSGVQNYENGEMLDSTE